MRAVSPGSHLVPLKYSPSLQTHFTFSLYRSFKVNYSERVGMAGYAMASNRKKRTRNRKEIVAEREWKKVEHEQGCQGYSHTTCYFQVSQCSINLSTKLGVLCLLKKIIIIILCEKVWTNTPSSYLIIFL